MSSEITNRFLNSLSPRSREHLTSQSTAVPMRAKAELYASDRMPAYTHFMTSGVASVVTSLTDGGIVEVGMIGNEGLAGALHVIGPAPVSTQCFVQLEGTALRMPLASFREAFRSSEEIRDRTLEFIQEQTVSLAQLAACHRLHEAEERLARWLLMAQDRVQSDLLNFTQEFLAEMLGARRTTVTLVAGTLQRLGMIEYRRGRVKILDRPSLESAACDCYQVLKPLFMDLYKHARPAVDGSGRQVY